MKKYIFLISLFFLSFTIYADVVKSPLNYTLTGTEGIKWEPEQGIFFSSTKISLTSESGRIYYLINNNLSSNEPIEYKDELYLSGEKGRIVDYDIVAILEKDNGTLEFFSRTYRIDRLNREKKKVKSDFSYKYEKKTDDEKNINLTYDFGENDFILENREREFNFSLKLNEQEKKNIFVKSEAGKRKVYITNAAYYKDKKITYEIKNDTIDLEKPTMPDLGSLYWGQIYKQNDIIQIKSKSKYDKVYYWYKERKNEDLLFGPPDKNDLNKWTIYENPIALESKYGLNGTIAIAAFSIGKNGVSSDISGPYFFKANGVENPSIQKFADLTSDYKEKKVYLNNIEFKNEKIVKINSKAVIKFENFNEDDYFYFTFKSNCSNGKSELIPCENKYTINNKENEVVEFNIYFNNNKLIGSFYLTGEDFVLPKIKEYISNTIDVSNDTIISYYMPDNKIRYESTSNFSKILEVTSSSQEFNGNIKLSAFSGEEKRFKVKFAAFDENDNIIKESDYYYLKIDKRNPLNDVSSDGIDFSIIHNEMQTLKLYNSESDSKIYYKLSKDDEWILYTEPIIFYPPLYGETKIEIFCMSKDRTGNTRINQSPYVLKFDRRGLFVDTTKNFSGNGTESSPYNSLERAVFFAKEKKCKIIYLISKNVDQFFPLQIESDIILQPFNLDNISSVSMETKTVWKQNHFWFNVGVNGYLEIRNVNFSLKSGNAFVNVNNNKLKIYNSNIIYSGKNDFKFFLSLGGKIGVNNVSLNVTDNEGKISFIDSNRSYFILKNIIASIKCKDIEFFKISDNIRFELENVNLTNICSNTSIFLTSDNSNVTIKNFIYKQTDGFKDTNLFMIKNTILNLSSSDFIIHGSNPFETKICDESNSKIDIKDSLIRIVNGFSCIGFNVNNSEIKLDKTMIDINNITDYIYTFRLFNSKMSMKSSVVKNTNTTNAITFFLNKSDFQGINNSIFTTNISNKGFAFWINSEGDIDTVNSLYYFDKNTGDSKFLFINNGSLIIPGWYSNAVSSGITLIENLNYTDNDNSMKDFNEKNIFYDFKDDFNFDSKFYFIPLKDSPILQGGLDGTKSPLKIPEKDFFGKNRVLGSAGIDIGAVQKSGN